MIFQRFKQCKQGANALDYSLIIAGIFLLIIAGVFALGLDFGEFFSSLFEIFNS